MTNNQPLVSILTPIFNGNRKGYLDKCIESVMNQTYENIEHIFADGGSTDGTLEKLAEYQKRYPDKIKFFSKKDNGVGSALKRAYSMSKGDIIGWIDSDDFYETNAVETIVRHYNANPQTQYVYGGCNMVNENDDVIGNFVIRDFDKTEWLNCWHYIVFCATFFKRDVIEKVGFVNDLGNDLYFYLKVAKKFKLERLEGAPLTNWRLHDGSISLKRADRENEIRKNRAKEDFFLVLRHGGSLFSPRAMTYYAVIERSVAKAIKPFLGFAFPLLRKLSYEMKYCISISQRTTNNGFALPFFKRVFQTLKGSIRKRPT